jgi:hypothetical protein
VKERVLILGSAKNLFLLKKKQLYNRRRRQRFFMGAFKISNFGAMLIIVCIKKWRSPLVFYRSGSFLHFSTQLKHQTVCTFLSPSRAFPEA